MFRYTIIIFMCLAIGIAGCGLTATGTAFEATVRDKAATAYDEGLVNAELFMCNDTSVGSVKRRYFRTLGDAKIYNDFCQQSGVLRADPVTRSP